MFADATPTFDSNAFQAKDFDPTGWELALVTTPSSDISSANERQLVGHFVHCFSLSVIVQFIALLMRESYFCLLSPFPA